MRVFPVAACGATAAILTIGLITASAALAEPGNYAGLPVDPNIITDSTAYIAAEPTLNPDGQPGVEAVFTHRDSSRRITDTILVLSDPAAASAALEGATPVVVTTIPGGGSEPAPVGAGGTIVTGASPDGTQSVTVVRFTEGGTAAVIEFSGAPSDPVPSDLAVEYAQKQAAAIRDAGAV
ncbi:hypothetical protein [Mycolicibacterium hodleri]|uniref:DUF5642 domain-containing protein n=1 Tax=Mycolicibacterium hodleri TaxID=49897 RepID=A0A502DSK7_9MYCO|nr:hypothetical protein [Mycolicibacterium hodleri]TPG28317.1 hypothetical protein EAH80_27645 [Mycolicibacterium hodleri]